MKLLTVLAIILTLFIRCQANTEVKQEESYSLKSQLPPPPPLNARSKNKEEQSELKSTNHRHYEEAPVVSTVEFTPPLLLPEKVIRHAYVRMQVKDYTASTQTLKAFISRRKAFISNAEENRTDGNLQNTFTIRVTDENFDLLVQDLLQESVYLEHKNITAQDVTEEHLDVAARLKTKKKIEERYIALLARANNVKDILAIEEELKTLQEEIESAEARQRYLQNQVAYSTIVVDYFQTVASTTPPENAIVPQITKALAEGWQLCLFFFYGVIKLWPMWVLVLILFYLIRHYRKNRLAGISAPTS